VANTLAYYDTATFTAIKSFIVHALGVTPSIVGRLRVKNDALI